MKARKPAPRLGPFPCGEARCNCTKGGCDHLGPLSPDEVKAARIFDDPSYRPGPCPMAPMPGDDFSDYGDLYVLKNGEAGK